MLFNGHTQESISTIDEETFAEICVMFHDGILGGKGVFDAITPLTTAVFNYLRPAGTNAYKSELIFPWISEYDKNPDLEIPDKEKVSNSLLTFLAQAPGFSMEKINGGNSAV